MLRAAGCRQLTVHASSNVYRSRAAVFQKTLQHRQQVCHGQQQESWTPKDCVMAMSLEAAHCWKMFCCQKTQATVTTCTIGTQCALGLPINSSSQTYEDFPVLELDDAQAGASERSPPSQGGGDLAAKTGPHTCFCGPDSGYTGSLPKGSNGIQFGGKLYSCLSCQRHDCQTAHVRVGASGKMPYVCPLCNKAYQLKRSLDTHMRAHSGERPYMCSICQKRFTQKCHLVKHERSHSGDKPYVCSICQKSFTNRSNMLSHEKMHSGERPHVCSICQKSFTNRSNLVSHEKRHSGERPFVCGICLKTFTHRGHLVTHERLHSGEKPYVCRVCQKGFSRNTDLVHHEKLHSGEKPHACSICQKGFIRKAELIKHERLHTDERPYTCSVCQKSFAQKWYLVKHERRHTSKL